MAKHQVIEVIIVQNKIIPSIFSLVRGKIFAYPQYEEKNNP